jgi:lipid-A-disaccharide synthase-like uncharacterized protein
MSTYEMMWVGIGFVGQTLFFSRWLLQWFVSERRGESQIPVSFWYMSLIGSLVVLAYAFYRMDPVFIVGQGVGTLVYIRNIMLVYQARKRVASV